MKRLHTSLGSSGLETFARQFFGSVGVGVGLGLTATAVRGTAGIGVLEGSLVGAEYGVSASRRITRILNQHLTQNHKQTQVTLLAVHVVKNL